MDIVVIFNGLGNQMSQFAFYLAKKEVNNRCTFIFDYSGNNNHNGYELEELFDIKINRSIKNLFFSWLYQLKKKRFISRILSFFCIRKISENQRYVYSKEFVNKGPFGINFYWGGWPSEKHFSHMEEKIRKTFLFPEQTSYEFLKWKNMIDEAENSVSIHIRRGDYLKYTNDMYQFGGVANLDYFNKAISMIRQQKKDSIFFVFSDDLEWCKKQFIGDGFFFIDCNRGKESWRDMYMISLCRHHINSNSTFSWWGAWLSNYKDSITICPREYIRGLETPDVYPENWIKI